MRLDLIQIGVVVVNVQVKSFGIESKLGTSLSGLLHDPQPQRTKEGHLEIGLTTNLLVQNRLKNTKQHSQMFEICRATFKGSCKGMFKFVLKF